MKLRSAGIFILTALLLASCGQEKRELMLMDSMPAGYDIYITLNQQLIGMEDVLSRFGEIAQAEGGVPPMVSEMLGFDPFDWNGWVKALALRADGEIGLIIDMEVDTDDPDLVVLYLPSGDFTVVEDFVDQITGQMDDTGVKFLFDETEGYVVVAIAQDQSRLDRFKQTMGTGIDSDEEFIHLREKASSDIPAVEIYAMVSAFSGQNDVDNILVTCFADGSKLGFQMMVRTLNMEAIETTSVIAAAPNSGSLNIPSDAIGALRASANMEEVKRLIAENMPPDAQMGVAMLGFGSMEELFDIFSGDTYVAVQSYDGQHAGVIEYGLVDADAAENMLNSISGMMAMSGESGYSTFDFHGKTCYSFDAEIVPGIDRIEVGVVGNALVAAGGYGLQDVIDGTSFSSYLESTGLGIEDRGGFVLAADFGELAEAFDLNREIGYMLDLEQFGYIALSGSVESDLFVIDGALDVGEGNPFVVMADGVVASVIMGMKPVTIAPVLPMDTQIPVEEFEATAEEDSAGI